MARPKKKSNTKTTRTGNLTVTTPRKRRATTYTTTQRTRTYTPVKAEPSVVPSKPWYMSKTLWMNVCYVLAAVFTGLGNMLGTAGAVTVLGVLNFLVRFITEKKLV